MNKILTLITALVAVGFLVGCGEKPEPPPSTAPTAEPQVFSATPPDGTPVPIPRVRTEAQPGDAVVLAGKIMGVKAPFVEGRGVFVIGDEGTLTSCDMDEEDLCDTPWDTCCDTSEARVAGTATIQVLDGEGKVLGQGLKGVGGLHELSRVVVAGTVAPNSTPESLIVNAQAIHVVP